MSRIYISGVGHNTKKMSQKLWIDCNTGIIHAKTECDNQPYSWCNSQSELLVNNYRERLTAAINDEPYLYGWYVQNDCDDVPTVYFERGYKFMIDHELSMSEDVVGALKAVFHQVSESEYQDLRAKYEFKPLSETPFTI